MLDIYVNLHKGKEKSEWTVIAASEDGVWMHEHPFPTHERASRLAKRIKETIGNKRGRVRTKRISSSRYWIKMIRF